jgi:hypothetical protein
VVLDLGVDTTTPVGELVANVMAASPRRARPRPDCTVPMAASSGGRPVRVLALAPARRLDSSVCSGGSSKTLTL